MLTHCAAEGVGSNADAGVSADGGATPDADGAAAPGCGSFGWFCEDFDGAASVADLVKKFGGGNGEGHLSLFTYDAGAGLRATLGPADTVGTLIYKPVNRRPGEVVVEVDVRVQKIGGPVGLFSLDYFDNTGAIAGLGVVVRADGRVSLDAGATKRIDTGIVMSASAWHKLRIVAPTGTARADLEVDGSAYSTPVAYLDGAKGGFQIAFGPYLETALGSEQVVEYDNLRVALK